VQKNSSVLKLDCLLIFFNLNDNISINNTPFH
jgi:hypothetical protein